MLMTILNVVYVLIAIAMIALILMQRGAGAQAGSGFGAGASATVFGARGAGNFLSKSTKWLAITFFVIALFMGWSATHAVRKPVETQQQDLGLMGGVPSAPASSNASPSTAAPSNAIPSAPVPAAPAPTAAAVPVAPPASATTQQPQAPTQRE